jgi:hypothetical protein
VLQGGGAAILKLRRGVEFFAGKGGDLDADGAVGRLHGGDGALQADAALLPDADAEGAGLSEDKLLKGGALRLVAEDGEQSAGAAFLHDDRGEHDVKRAGGERGLSDVREELGREIVERGFEYGDDFRSARSGRLGNGGGEGFAEAETEDVGEAGVAAGAGAVADAMDEHDGAGSKAGCEGADDGGASGRDELLLYVGGVGGEAAEKISSSGRRHREGAVSADDGAAANVERRAEPLIDLEMMDAGGGGDDVNDGIDRADFVEVNLVDGDVVDLRFGVAEELKGADGEELDGLCERCGLNESANRGEGTAMHMGMVMLVIVGVAVIVFMTGRCGGFGELVTVEDVDLGAGDAAAVHGFNAEGGVEAEGGGSVMQHLRGHARVNQRAEKHVSGDTGEAIKRSDTHQERSFKNKLGSAETQLPS